MRASCILPLLTSHFGDSGRKIKPRMHDKAVVAMERYSMTTVFRVSSWNVNAPKMRANAALELIKPTKRLILTSVRNSTRKTYATVHLPALQTPITKRLTQVHVNDFERTSVIRAASYKIKFATKTGLRPYRSEIRGMTVDASIQPMKIIMPRTPNLLFS